VSHGFTVMPTALPGCMHLHLPQAEDARGDFIKLFHAEALRTLGIGGTIAEVFHTTSKRHVIRGLHFQRPPHAHSKWVICLHGTIQDVALDLRRRSPTYGRHITLTLDGNEPSALFLPEGLAHGFCVTSESACVLYMTSREHAPESDAGIAWDSAGIEWATTTPILSSRDRTHPTLAAFDSPFDDPVTP